MHQFTLSNPFISAPVTIETRSAAIARFFDPLRYPLGRTLDADRKLHRIYARG